MGTASRRLPRFTRGTASAAETRKPNLPPQPTHVNGRNHALGRLAPAGRPRRCCPLAPAVHVGGRREIGERDDAVDRTGRRDQVVVGGGECAGADRKHRDERPIRVIPFFKIVEEAPPGSSSRDAGKASLPAAERERRACRLTECRDAASAGRGTTVRCSHAAQLPCIVFMFSVIAASDRWSSSLGLNCTNSLPASAWGT